MRALILGHRLDPTTNAVAVEIAARHGEAAARRITLDQLAAARWEHRLTARGAGSTALDLGFENKTDFDVVFNRIEPLSTLAFAGWSGGDRDYGRSEMLALLLSWLESLGPRVVNRPGFGSLVGPIDRPWPWLARAAAAGLPPHPVAAITSSRLAPPMQGSVERADLLPAPTLNHVTVDRPIGCTAPAAALVDLLVVGDVILGGEIASEAHEGCLRLARMVGTDLLAVRLTEARGDPNWRFVAANPMPVIDAGRPLAVLIDLLESRARCAR